MCNIFLGINSYTMDQGNFSEKAHIEAVGKMGPRYRELMENDELNSADNLMLLCKVCHKTIDDNPGKYPVDRLKQIKRDHEERVYYLTRCKDIQKSYMIGYFSAIAENKPEFENDLFCKALISDKKIPSVRYINLIGSTNIYYADGTKDYYSVQEKLIESETERIIKQCIRENENLSVFALAPIPLLIKLGKQLSDIPNVSVFQCHRKEDKWSWEENNHDTVDFILESPNKKGQERVALNLSLSADISETRITRSVGDIPIYKITIDNPNRNFVTNKEIMDQYVCAYRRCMEEIKYDNPDLKEVLVFPAMPNSLAIRTGMDYMPKCDPKLIIYDQIKQTNDFIETIAIGG